MNDSLIHAAKWARKAAAMAVSCLALFAALASTASAEGVDYADIDRQYYRRNEGNNLQLNIDRLEKDGGGSAEALWRLCRAKVRSAEKREKRAEKLALYASAKDDCEKSVALSSGAAEAHFWSGVALGRWGETKGLMKALFIIKPLKKEMAEVIRLDPSHGGAHNVLAEILWQVPGIVGGDKKRALEEFETALRLSPRYTANHQPLAEAYLHFGRKDDAIRVLKMVEATKDPADPAEYPENLADAKKLLEKIER